MNWNVFVGYQETWTAMIDRDEAGIILYDSTDDMDENEAIPEDNDIFTDEYMLALTDAEDRKIARMKRIDRMISGGVIVGIAMYVAMMVWIFFWA